MAMTFLSAFAADDLRAFAIMVLVQAIVALNLLFLAHAFRGKVPLFATIIASDLSSLIIETRVIVKISSSLKVEPSLIFIIVLVM